jgi:hypothetical protein
MPDPAAGARSKSSFLANTLSSKPTGKLITTTSRAGAAISEAP